MRVRVRLATMRLSPTLPFFSVLGLLAWQDAGSTRELELVYLANEGFLLRSGEASLVIDAFVTRPYAGYAAVPEELFADLLEARAPFEDVDLALTSHVHGDHFQPEPAAEFLAARPEVPFLSSRQVVEQLAERVPDEQRAGTRAFLPEARARVETGAGGIRVELLRLPHTGGARTADVQNLGHLIQLGDVRILHVGDADVATGDLASYELAGSAIDVALVPYWWLGDAQALARVRALVGARRYVAIHVPPGEVAQVKRQLEALDPGLLLFEEPGEARTVSIGG